MTERLQTSAATRTAADLVSQYFAYLAVLAVGVMVAVVTMYYSAHAAISWVDAAAFPDRNPSVMLRPMMQDQTSVQQHPNAFAMLPAAAPLRMQSDVVSSNF